MPTRALSGARMVRDLGVSNEFLAANVASASKIQQVPSDRFISRGLANTSTGNVQGEQPWYDVQVPDWTTGAHITNFSTLQYYLSSVAETNSLVPASAVFEENFGSFSGSQAFYPGVLAPNGFIYLTPYTSQVFAKINPNNNTVTTFGSVPASGGGLHRYQSSILAPNGKIYITPSRSTIGIVLDPSNDTITSYGTFFATNITQDNLGRSVLAPNGKIYIMASLATNIIVVDPSNNTISSFGTLQGGTANVKGNGLCLASNGKLYSSPNSSTIIFIIDPSVNTIATIVGTGTSSCISNIQGPNGNIYYIPNNGTPAVLDPNNNTITTFGFVLPGSHFGSVLLPNGKIFACPSVTTSLSIIDPSNNTVTTFGTYPSGSTPFSGGVAAPNGKIYMSPYNSTTAKAYNFMFNNTFNLNVYTNPMVTGS